MPDARIDTGAEASTAQTPEDRGGGLMLSRARRWCVIAINARISDVSARLVGGQQGTSAALAHHGHVVLAAHSRPASVTRLRFDSA